MGDRLIGRTQDFDSCYRGSSPCPPANTMDHMMKDRTAEYLEMEYMMEDLTARLHLAKVNESFTVYRYDNGWMIEIGGKDSNDDWKTQKIICNSENELIGMIKLYNMSERSD